MQIVLVKIYYENHKSVLITTLSEVESIGLTIMTTNVLPFTTSSLDITIMATVSSRTILYAMLGRTSLCLSVATGHHGAAAKFLGGPPISRKHSLPLARIKKIMKADEDVRMITTEALVVFVLQV
ncbi:hypothetical protein ABZP36_031613 [Zizania latifolia]